MKQHPATDYILTSDDPDSVFSIKYVIPIDMGSANWFDSEEVAVKPFLMQETISTGRLAQELAKQNKILLYREQEIKELVRNLNNSCAALSEIVKFNDPFGSYERHLEAAFDVMNDASNFLQQ